MNKNESLYNPDDLVEFVITCTTNKTNQKTL